MKQGTFDIINGTPIVFAHELEKPNPDDYFNPLSQQIAASLITDLEEYESSRKEWKVENILEITGLYFLKIGYKATMHPDYELKKGRQIQFKEITPPTDKERGKCKIVKII